MLTRSIAALTLALTLPLAPPVAARAADWNTNEDNVVLDGYDVVAYLLRDEPVRGDTQYAAQYQGARFHFASREHLEAFRSESAKYAPKFGGFCAFGLASQGVKAPVNPATFKLRDGELLLFFDDLYEGRPFNTKPLWNQNESQLLEQAERAWSKLSSD